MEQQLKYINLAIENYYFVIKNDRNHWRSRFNLYLIYINQKNYQKAFILINNVLRINPGYQPALRDKALVYYYQNRPDEGKIIDCLFGSLCIKTFKKLPTLTPINIMKNNIMGEISQIELA